MSQIPFGHLLYYLTETDGLKWRSVDYNMRIVVKSLKHETFNGYGDFRIGKENKRITSTNCEELVEPVIGTLARNLRPHIKLPVSVVPIPNSNMAVGEKGTFRNEHLASLLAKHLGPGATMVPALRWKRKRAKAHMGKEMRSPDLHEPNLVLVQKPPNPVLLFDDVLTSGSQMIAAARFLKANGCSVVFATVIAHVTKEQHDLMVKWTTSSLDVSRSTTVFG